MTCEIHQTAIVDSRAELADGVFVGPYSIIGPNVSLGENTWVGPHVVIEGRTSLGPDNKVFQFASLGSIPQDLKYRGEPSTVVIGAGNIIREYVTIQPGTQGGLMTTKVGDRNLFMANAHVGHDCIVGNNNVFANGVGLAGHVQIMNWAVLGGMVGVHQFCRIGDYAMLSGGSKVGQDIPPYCVGQGDRAVLRGINLLALKRAKFSEEDISKVKKLYRSLFMTIGGLEQKINNLPEDLRSSPVAELLIKFCSSSSRGIASSRKGQSAGDDL